MVHDIQKPDISPDFTVEDIHKIREWHYERLKDATPDERSADEENRAERTRRTIEELRRAKFYNGIAPSMFTKKKILHSQ